jgi:hypothetical protein
VQITVHGDTLIIRGESKADEERKGQTWHLRERRFGAFQRAVSLTVPVDADKAQAGYDQGVLTLTLPKAEQAKPKQIRVGGGSAPSPGGGPKARSDRAHRPGRRARRSRREAGVVMRRGAAGVLPAGEGRRPVHPAADHKGDGGAGPPCPRCRADMANPLTMLGLGAGLMYYLDPARGRSRRARAFDGLAHALRQIEDAIEVGGRDLGNRAGGLIAEAGSQRRRDEAPDEVIEARVRSKLGRVVSHPRAIEVTARGGRVTLRGPVLAAEADLLRRRSGGSGA